MVQALTEKIHNDPQLVFETTMDMAKIILPN
jgi:hypothetical protein